MSNDIDNLKGYNPGGSGSGVFLKIDDGKSVRVRLASLPIIFDSTFTAPDGEASITTRFAFVVWNREEKKAQIWQTNGATYGQQIANLLEEEEYGDWRNYDVKISRSGQKAQTRYTVLAGKTESKLEPDEQAAVDKLIGEAIDIIDKAASTSQVMWLTEYKKLEAEGKLKQPEADVDQTPPKDDVVIEDISDEPVNLDDIPF